MDMITGHRKQNMAARTLLLIFRPIIVTIGSNREISVKYEVFIEKPAVAMNGVTTTRRLHSTDFIRLKTLTFGVTVPKTWTRKIGVNSLRLYASANNLWTWAAYDFYDPESVSAGTAGWGTPPLKTVTFGLNLNF